MSHTLPQHLRFTKEHEWVEVEGDAATIGITEHAQEQLGDLVFVELPEIGRTLSSGEEFAVVESVKAASEVYAPISGTVLEVNEDLGENPQTINQDPYSEGWLVKIKIADKTELDDVLMSASDYSDYLETIS